jgi:hypothetical protein
VKADGFGVVYPDPGFDYFPTGHEATGNGSKHARFDVCLYNCFSQEERDTFNPKNLRSADTLRTLDNAKTYNLKGMAALEVLRLLPTDMTQSDRWVV